MKYLKVFTDFNIDMESLSFEERGRLFSAMLAYAADGTASPLSGNERFLWGTAKKQIDAQQKSYESKCESAAKAREDRSQKSNSEIRNKILKSEEEQEEEQEQKKSKKGSKRFAAPTTDQVEEKILVPNNEEKILVPDDMPKAVQTALNEWLEYKGERKQKYTVTGWKKLLTRIRNATEKYGENKVIELIDFSMSNNYQGIFFDRLGQQQQNNKSINFDYEQREIHNEDFEHMYLDLDADEDELLKDFKTPKSLKEVFV